MGQPKATLELDGETLIERVVAVVRPEVARVIVCAAYGQQLPPLGEAVDRVDDPAEANGLGPLVALVSGLGHAQALAAEQAFVTGVDLPALTRTHVVDVFGRLAHAQSVLPVVAGIAQPLASAVQVAPALAAARRLVDAGERALVRVFDELAPLDRFEVSEPAVLEDVDTPSAWHAFVRSRR
jgi:molybdopterin-guanine dinucleotide biosynthesis protein A